MSKDTEVIETTASQASAELARHGARCRIVDRMPEPSKWCRAIGVTPRTLEIWHDMGIAREMIDSAIWDRWPALVEGE